MDQQAAKPAQEKSFPAITLPKPAKMKRPHLAGFGKRRQFHAFIRKMRRVSVLKLSSSDHTTAVGCKAQNY